MIVQLTINLWHILIAVAGVLLGFGVVAFDLRMNGWEDEEPDYRN